MQTVYQSAYNKNDNWMMLGLEVTGLLPLAWDKCKSNKSDEIFIEELTKEVLELRKQYYNKGYDYQDLKNARLFVKLAIDEWCKNSNKTISEFRTLEGNNEGNIIEFAL
jgi:hypothetical protein